MKPTERRLTDSEVHDILRNDRRRFVIEHLRGNGQFASVSDLADVVAAVEAEESPPPRNVRQSVYVSLHQTHLPKLDDCGVVDFDSDANEVRLRDAVDQLVSHMDPHAAVSSPRGGLYLGVALAGISLAATSMLGLPLLSALPGVLWATLALILIGMDAGYRLFRPQVERVLSSTD